LSAPGFCGSFSAALRSIRLWDHRNSLPFGYVNRWPIAFDAEHAVFRRHHYSAIQHSHFTEGLETRNGYHGHVADFHANRHPINIVKHGNVALV
jgi:hypothetical protein